MSILLPTSFTLNQVSKLDSLVRFRNGRQYSKQEIKKIITNHEPLKNLIKAFKEQVQFEFESLQFDNQTRIFFYKAFKKLQKQNQDLIPSLKTKISNLEKNPQLTEEDAKKLKRLKKEYLFLTEGRMGETIRLFAKIILPFNALDNNYGSRIMSFANNSMYLKYDEIVDDPVPPVSSNEIHAFSQYDRSGLKEQNKAVIPINEPLILPERIQIRDQIIQQACQNAEEMSPIIQDVIHRFDLPTEIKSKIRTITFRGPIGAGKSYWLKDLGINEHKISNADSLKEFLGGNLSHHESCVLSAAIRKNTGSFFQIDFNTNVRQRDLDKLTNPPKGAVNLILDLNISLDKLIDHHQTIIQQGNRQASEKEIFDSHSDSINHRVYVIKAALENENIVWQLYDNNADNRALVVSIINKEVKIERPDLLEKLLEGQDQMRELFLYHSSLKNNAFINQGLIRV